MAPPSSSHDPSPHPSRAAGLALIGTLLATIGLLALHPATTAQDFAGVVRDEAAHRAMDAAVHGGFLAVMAVAFAGLCCLARRLGMDRFVVLLGLTSVGAGMAALGASMIVDGLVVPALAARILAAGAVEAARPGFQLCSALIGALMPLGLLFQAAGAALLGVPLARSQGWPRVAGIAGLATGAVVVVAILVAQGDIAIFGGIALLALWNGLAGFALLRWSDGQRLKQAWRTAAAPLETVRHDIVSNTAPGL